MTEVVNFFLNMFSSLIGVFDSVKFELFGYEVSIIGILVVILVIGLVVSVFWKGARS